MTWGFMVRRGYQGPLAAASGRSALCGTGPAWPARLRL